MKKEYKSPYIRVISMETESLIAESTQFEYDTTKSADPEEEVMSRSHDSFWESE